MRRTSEITPVLKMYLKCIYLKGIKGYSVRATDIAKELNVSKSGVNRAVNVLKSLGLVNHQSYGGVSLTPEGRNYAKDLIRKSELVKRFLMYSLNLKEDEALLEANRIEHNIGQRTLAGIEEYISGYAG